MELKFKCPACDGKETWWYGSMYDLDPRWTWECQFCDGWGRVSIRKWLVFQWEIKRPSWTYVSFWRRDHA
jgi:hypothetical protein